jgi:hypothetical protein
MDTKDWEKTDMQVFWGEIAPCGHVVQIYENDKVFMDLLQGFVSSGLNAGDSVIIIATSEHLKVLNQRLKAQGYDLFSLTLQDQFIPLKAEETLSQFMINGWPDENLFYHLLTNLLLRARKRNRQVRAFGELVALLWAQGYSGATVHLEHLWSRFCESEAFSLFCAYPKSGFTQDANESIINICGCHSRMVAGLSNSSSDLLYKNVVQKIAS